MELNFSPLSIQGPLGFGSPNDRNDQVPIDHQQPQSEDHEGLLGFGSPIDRNDQVPIDQQTGDRQQPQSEDHVGPLGFSSPNDRNDQVPIDQQTDYHQQPQSGAHVAVNVEPEAGDSLLSEPMRYVSWLSFLENFILGPNQSNQIWRLRLLSGISLYIAAVVGFLFYIGNIPKAHVPYHYQMVLLITSVGAPIAVATFSLFVSFWLEFVPNRRSNWITGLSIANFILLCGPLVIFWSHKWEAGN